MLEFVCLPWSEVCSARVTSLLLLFIINKAYSKKVSLRVKFNVYSAMVLSVLLFGAAESWALSKTQLSTLENPMRVPGHVQPVGWPCGA